jgi:hypothetical protein
MLVTTGARVFSASMEKRPVFSRSPDGRIPRVPESTGSRKFSPGEEKSSNGRE